MTKYLALLRGINVSGHNMIKMDALKKMLENMGFQNVETYIQSGNVFLESEEENAASIGFKIKQEISKVFGYDVPVIMISKSNLELCFKNNPFLKGAAPGRKAEFIRVRRLDIEQLGFGLEELENLKA